MEDKAIKEAWDWLDEDFNFDSESPLVISHSLWGDFSEDAAVVRTLFASTPASQINDSVSSAFTFGKQDTVDYSEPGSSDHITSDRSPPLKRRRMLKFSEDQSNVGPCLSDPLENCSDSFIEVCEDFQAQGPSSSSSLWYIANEESLSSVDDAVEQSAESWMAGCFSDSDTKEFQDVAQLRNPINFGFPAIPANGCTDVSSRRQQTCKSDAHLSLQHAKSNQHETSGLQPSGRSCSLAKSHSVKENSVAYPFALVKPSGIQGDVTLKDINQRIRTRPIKNGVRSECEQPKIAPVRSPSRLAFSGKSVVSLTRIHIVGNGSITIKRTRS